MQEIKTTDEFLFLSNDDDIKGETHQREEEPTIIKAEDASLGQKS